MVIPTAISVTVPVSGPTVISVIRPIISIATSVTVISPSSVAILILIPTI